MNGFAPTAGVPDNTPPAPTPVPWFHWPPDRKVWAGGVSGVLAWVVLSVAAHYGVDPQPVADGITTALGVPHIDVLASLAGVIGLATAYITNPTLRDVYRRVNNGVVMMANADPTNPTTAVAVSEPESDAQTAKDVRAGLIPSELVQKIGPLASPPATPK